MADKSTFDIKIRTDADLKALQAAKAEFAEQAKVIKEAGGESQVLEKNLETLDARIGQRKLALYIQDLKENIAALKDAGHETGELEQALAQTQNATGGGAGDKWEVAGEIIGGGIKAAAVAAVALATATSKAGEEIRKMARDAAEDVRQLGDSIEAGPTQALEHATSKARGLKTQLEDLADKGLASKIQDIFGEVFGKENNDEKAVKFLRLLSQIQDLGHQGAAEAHNQAMQVSDAQKLRLEGLEAEAAAKERELARDKEIAKEKLKFAPDERDKPGESTSKKRDLANAENDIRERFQIKERQIAKDREKAAAKETAALREQADEASLREQNLDAAAEKKKRSYELEQKLLDIEKQRNEGKLTLGESVDQSDAVKAKSAAEQKKSDSDRAASAAKRLEMARDERESAEALLQGETARAQIAKINKQLAREKADIIKANTPEIAAQIIAEKEATAEAKRQYALKKDAKTAAQKKADYDTALEAAQEKLEAATAAADHDKTGAANKKIDADLTREIARNNKTYGKDLAENLNTLAEQTAELQKQSNLDKRREEDEKAVNAAQDQIAQQRTTNAGLKEEGAQLGINAELRNKLIAIKASDHDPQAKQRLTDLANEEAGLKRLKLAREDVNKTPAQKEGERVQQKKDAQSDRIAESRALEKERAKRMSGRDEDGGYRSVKDRHFPPEAEQAFLKEQFGKPPKETDADRREKFFQKGGKYRHMKSDSPENGESMIPPPSKFFQEGADAKADAKAEAKAEADLRSKNPNRETAASRKETNDQYRERDHSDDDYLRMTDEDADKFNDQMDQRSRDSAPDVQPVADAVSSGGDAIVSAIQSAIEAGMATIASALQGQQQVDVSPIQTAIDSMRSDLQSQIDDIRS